MGGTRDDEQLLILRNGIGFDARCRLALHHIFISILTEVARMGFLSVHHKNGRANLVGVVKETGIGVCLSTYYTPSVVRVTAAFMIAAFGLVVVVIVLHELRSIGRQRVNNTASHSLRISQTLLGHCLSGSMARFLLVLAVEITITADAGHIIHRGGNGSLDAGIGSGSIQGNASPSADAYDANLLSIHIVLL